MEVRAASIADELGRLSEAALADGGRPRRMRALTGWPPPPTPSRRAPHCARGRDRRRRAGAQPRGNARVQAVVPRLARFAAADRRSRVCAARRARPRRRARRSRGIRNIPAPAPAPRPRPDPNPNLHPMTPGIRRTRASASRRARRAPCALPLPLPLPLPPPPAPTRCAWRCNPVGTRPRWQVT